MNFWTLRENGKVASFVVGMDCATLGAAAWPGRSRVLAILPSSCHMPSTRCHRYRKAWAVELG